MDCPPYIYFIQAGEGGPIKIGMALDVQKRFYTLRVANSEFLKLLHSQPGSPLEEKHMHEKWAAHRIRGEWFRPDKEITNYIANKLHKRRMPKRVVDRSSISPYRFGRAA